MVDNTYTGSKDGSWNTGSNWSLGHIPTAEENAIIPSGKGTVKITNEGRCASLRILSSGALQLLGSGTVAGDQIRLDVRGNAVATGDFTLGNGELSAYNVLFNVGGDLCISNTSKSASFKVYAGDAYGSNVNSVTSILNTKYGASTYSPTNDPYLQRYLPAAVLKGATPANGYQPQEPYTVEMKASINKHQDLQFMGNGRVMYLYIMGKGWDTEQRQVEIILQGNNELHQVFNCPSLYTQCKQIQGTWKGLK